MVDRVAAAAGVLVAITVRTFSLVPYYKIHGQNLRDGVGASSNGLSTALAVPDADGVSLDSVLAAEGTDVAGVLGDFHLLHLLSEGSTITGAIFTGHTDLCKRISSGAERWFMGRVGSLFVRFVILSEVDEYVFCLAKEDVVGESIKLAQMQMVHDF